MTALDERTVAAPAETSAARRSGATAWRFAARLARREVRRRPGRTALVALLVAVPVLAMVVGSVLHRTTGDDWSAAFARRAGHADVAIDLPLAEGASAVWRSLVPGDAHVVEHVVVHTGLLAADGSRDPEVFVRFDDLPLEDPLADGIVEVRAGRAPAAADEVLLDGRTARRLGVGVGDVLALSSPAGDWRVVGLGRLSDNHNQGLMVVHDFDRARLRDDAGGLRVLIGLPTGATHAEGVQLVADLRAAGVHAEQRWEAPIEGNRDDVRVLAWGWVVGVLALVAVGIVIASAFATSARRQLVTIGQLSANGAPPRLVRRTLALQGSWTGLLGAAVGLGLAGVGLVALRPLAERVAGRTLGSYRLVPVDLVVIVLTAVVAATAAAAVPARGAAGVPVISALAGRRPLGTPSARLVPVGVALFVGGLFLLFVAASGAETSAYTGSGNADVFAFVAVLGALGVVFGMCCATPLLVQLVGRLGGSSARGGLRLAARSTARVRSRSAAVVTAVATAGAVAVAGVVLASVVIAEEDSSSLPADVVVLQRWTAWPEDAKGLVDPSPLAPLALEPDLRAAIDRLLPGVVSTPLRVAGVDPSPFDAEVGPSGDPDRLSGPEVAVVADPVVVELLRLGAGDRALLDDYDLVVLGGDRAVAAAPAAVSIADDGRVVTAVRAYASAAQRGSFSTLISPQRAAALGLDVVEVGVVLRAPSDLTAVQRRELPGLVWGSDAVRTAFVEPGEDVGAVAAPAPDDTSGLSLEMAWSTSPFPIGLVRALLVAAAVLLTLLVVAIGLSLSATESREERDVLVAVGAAPRTLSRVAGFKALVLAATGVVLAVPTGFLPTWVVYRTLDQRVAFPALTVAILVLAVPLVSGLAAWGTSAAARRLRPVHLSTSAAD